MAFPTAASGGVFSERWASVLRTTEQMRVLSQRLKDQADDAGSTVYSHKVAQYSTTLQGLKGTLDGLVAGANVGTPSFVDYAQTQVDDVSIDIVTEYTSLDSAHVALTAWLDTNIPLVGIYLFSGGVLVPVALSVGEKAALSTQLGTYLAEFLS